MKTTVMTLQESVFKAAVSRFPDFPTTVLQSPSDEHVLCVRVFAVPTEKVREVKSFVRQLEQELFPSGDYILLPMVKNLEVTRQHYPEYVRPQVSECFSYFADRKHTVVPVGAVWQIKGSSTVWQIIPTTSKAHSVKLWAKSTSLIAGSHYCSRPAFRPRHSDSEKCASNQELALAA